MSWSSFPDKVGSMKNNASQKVTLKASQVNLGNFRNESLHIATKNTLGI